MSVPVGLRHWFVAHFIVDALFAIPLLFFPEFFLHLFGWVQVDAALARVVGAALVAIGVQSLIGRNEGVEVFRAMLTLKVIWSGTATLGLAYSAMTGAAPTASWLFVFVFAVFCAVWSWYRLGLRAEGVGISAVRS